MKKFIKYIVGLLLFVIAFIYLMEFIYNEAYRTGEYRNKVMWMHDIKEESLDFVVFGSSRGNNYVIPNLILEKTGNRGLNLSMQASGPLEIELAVREFLKHNTAKRFFIQVDDSFNQEAPDKIGQLRWLPYIVDEEIYEVFKPYGKEYFLYRYVPFYRYLMFDSRIGYRNVILSHVKKGIDYSLSSGYTESPGELKKDKPFTIFLEDKSNPHFININHICKEKNIEVVYFTSPIYRPEGNFDVLDKRLRNYYNFSNELQNMELFSNPDHMNKKGATAFTDLMISLFFDSNADTIDSKN